MTYATTLGTGTVGLQLLQAMAVLVAILALAWAFRRFAAPRLGLGPRPGRMRVIERLPLEPRRSLYLVEVDGVPHLFGVSEGSVRLLDRPAQPAQPSTPAAGEAPR
ncbi:MAG TPA: flagellar biosynthetic protein FliO [Polyangia bacterium]|nr:flagellar biosynthetic protein FliO [Polyangia bacterium]